MGSEPEAMPSVSAANEIALERRVWRPLAMLLVVALAAVVAYGFWGFSYDDAFITYRYARSWEASGSLQYNPGEHVYGTTAPGYAVVLGSLAALTPGLDVPEWGTLVAVVAFLLLAWVLARSLSADGARLPDGVFAGAPLAFAILALTMPANVALFGAEAFPAAALVGCGALALFGSSAEIAAGLLLAGAAAFRLDAGLAACALGVAYWYARRRFPWRLAITGGLGVAAYLGFLAVTFGKILPHTLAIKRSELGLTAQRSYGLAEWGWLTRWMPAAALLFLCALALVGLFALARRGLLFRPPVVALLVWVGGVEVAYRLVGVPFAPWYAIDLVIALSALAVLGIAWLAASIARALSIRRRLSGPLVALLVAALLFPLVAVDGGWIGRYWRRPPDPRWEIYHRVGDWLRHNAERDDVVACVEVGFIGYVSRRPILGLLGLVSPGVLESRRRGTLPDLVARERPRFIVDVPWLRRLGLGEVLADSRIARSYTEAASFIDGRGRDVRVLERRTIAERTAGEGSGGGARSP